MIVELRESNAFRVAIKLFVLLFVWRHFPHFTRWNAGSKREHVGSERAIGHWRPRQKVSRKDEVEGPNKDQRLQRRAEVRSSDSITIWIHSRSPESLPATLAAVPCISSFPIPRLSAEVTIDKIDIMKFTKNIGMLLLAVYLIIDGLLGFGLNIGPAIFLLYVVALAAGVFILIGKYQ